MAILWRSLAVAHESVLRTLSIAADCIPVLTRFISHTFPCCINDEQKYCPLVAEADDILPSCPFHLPLLRSS